VVPFSEGHPQAASHHLRLRTKFVVPLLAGARPPRFPGPRPSESLPIKVRKWEQRACKFAEFAITVYHPWDLQTRIPPIPLTYAALKLWLDELQLTTVLLTERGCCGSRTCRPARAVPLVRTCASQTN
jgi:hypothetical protein